MAQGAPQSYSRAFQECCRGLRGPDVFKLCSRGVPGAFQECSRGLSGSRGAPGLLQRMSGIGVPGTFQGFPRGVLDEAISVENCFSKSYN